MNQQNLGSKRSASSSTGKIAAKSHEAVDQLKEKVVEQANEVREKAESYKEQAGERIRDVAVQLQHMSTNLREDDAFVADLAERASRGVERVASYVSASTPQSVVRDAERLARRQPALIFGSAFLIGLAAGRFLKSSSPGGSFQSGTGSDEGGDLAVRQDRSSGFFPSGGRTAPSDRRYQENYDAAFGRDMGARDMGGSEIGARDVRARDMGGREPAGRAWPEPANEGKGRDPSTTLEGQKS
jgi:hypothetical protein